MNKIFKKNNRVSVKHKLKNKDKLIPYGKFEFFFNLFSLFVFIGLGLYYGGRSYYYYYHLNNDFKQAVTTLNGSIISNIPVVTDGDGLHQDVDGYYFKGNVLNNYVKFANRVYRVIRVNNDGSVKIITDDIVSEFMWGEDNDYSSSNIHNWLTKEDEKDYSGVYYDTIPYLQDFLVKTNYTIPIFNKSSFTTGNIEYSDDVTTLSMKDYSNANGKNSYLNIGKYYWILGNDNEDNLFYVNEDGALLPANLYESYGVRAVMTLKNDLEISGGNGSKEDPYIINQGDKVNFVDNYVKMGDDVFKVFYHKDGYVKLAYTDYVGQDEVKSYSNRTSEFNISSRYHIGYYLNKTLYNSFSYNSLFVDFPTFTGEVSADTSLNFENNFSESLEAKVSLLNLFDYHNLDLDNYYLVNTTSSVGSMVYVFHNYGLLEEASVTDKKKVVPVVCISETSINKEKGEGTVSNPYVAE